MVKDKKGLKRTLITGGSGKLGRELVKLFPSSLHPTHQELDIIDRSAVFSYIDKTRPDIIIHCAALTGIKQCEDNKELAWNTNVVGTENIVDACTKYVSNCYLIYISTACVFYGDRGDYVETDIPYPKNFYSLTKLIAETIVRRSNLRWLVIRTNFVAREEWPYERAFIDRFGTYLFSDEVSLGIKEIVEKEITGIVHLCGDRKMSMYDVAKITTPNIKPMSLQDYNGPPLTVDMSLRSIRIKPKTLSRHLPQL